MSLISRFNSASGLPAKGKDAEAGQLSKSSMASRQDHATAVAGTRVSGRGDSRVTHVTTPPVGLALSFPLASLSTCSFSNPDCFAPAHFPILHQFYKHLSHPPIILFLLSKSELASSAYNKEPLNAFS